MSVKHDKKDIHGGFAVPRGTFMSVGAENGTPREVIGGRTNPGWVMFANKHALSLTIISNGAQLPSPTASLI